MIKIRAWWIFYRKIFLYSLLLTGLISLLAGSLSGKMSLVFPGFAYAFLSPFVHLFFYELNGPQEYYFYANLGLIRLRLWGITLGITFSIFILIALIR